MILQRQPRLLFFSILSLWCAGCLRAERTNPIDGNPSSLFASRPSILQPNGAEQWYISTDHQLLWNPGEVEADSTVSLSLSIDGGQTYPYPIATDITNTGEILWNIPDLPSTQCRIQIVSSDSLDMSDQVFTILRKPVPKQITTRGGQWPSWRNNRLAFMSDRSGNYDIWVRIAQRYTFQVTTSEAFDGFPAFDKKGFHLAFTSDRTGRNEIWATARFSTGGDRSLVQLTAISGTHPTWQPLPNARKLAFISTFGEGTNIWTLEFSAPLSPLSAINAPIVRVDDGGKEKPTWIIESFGQEQQDHIYYKKTGFRGNPSAITTLRVDMFEFPQTLNLPFTSPIHNPAISLNTARIAVSVDGDIWVISLEDGRIVGVPLQITFDPADDDVPDWRTDRELAFQSNRTGRWEIWTVTMP